jgi:hypothetical protein
MHGPKNKKSQMTACTGLEEGAEEDIYAYETARLE